MTTTTVTIKVFFEKSKGSHEREIRRFALNSSDGDCFIQAKEKIVALYQNLCYESFQLYWKDSDGDRIDFSTAEEMKDALKYVTDGVFRVYIDEVKKEIKSILKKKSSTTSIESRPPQHTTSTPPISPSTSSSHSLGQSQSHSVSTTKSNHSSFVHPDVECDGCGGLVKGMRYKCYLCPDFDLCGACEAKGIHSQHPKFKIPPTKINNPFYRRIGARETALRLINGSSQSVSTSREIGSITPVPLITGRRTVSEPRANVASTSNPFRNNSDHKLQKDDQYDNASSTLSISTQSEIPSLKSVHIEQNTVKASSTQTKKTPDLTPSTSKEVQSSGSAVDPLEIGDIHQQKASTKSNDYQTGTPNRENSSSQVSEGFTYADAIDKVAEALLPSLKLPVTLNQPTDMSAPTISKQTQESADTDSSPAQETEAPPTIAGGGDVYKDFFIQQRLSQMLTMGFTNKNNQLLELLKENSFDIGRTVDAMKAKTDAMKAKTDE